MFSSRISWNLAPNQISLALNAKRVAGTPILDLTESNPTVAGFAYPAEQIREALSDPGMLLYEPSAPGLLRAREAVAALYPAAGAPQIFLTASTSEAYTYLFKLFCSAGDEVLAPRPSYPLFEFLGGLESVSVKQYPLFYDHGWFIDTHALRSAVTPRTRAIIVVNPNNPTGSYLKRGELEHLIGICGEHDLALISDEVFAAYPWGPDPERVSSVYDVDSVPAFALSGLSKFCALPQMKLGWIVVNGPKAVREETRQRLELIADTFLSVGAPVQHGAARLIELGQVIQNQIRYRTTNNLRFLSESLTKAADVRLLRGEGGWYATVQVPRTRTELEWVLALLEEHNVLVQPGFFYDFNSEAFLVLSLLTPEPVFQAGVGRMMELMAGDDISIQSD